MDIAQGPAELEVTDTKNLKYYFKPLWYYLNTDYQNSITLIILQTSPA